SRWTRAIPASRRTRPRGSTSSSRRISGASTRSRRVLIVDAGPIVASMSSGEAHHQRCADLLSRAEQPLQVPAFVAAEVAHIVDKRLGPRAELAFARAFASGELFVEPVEPQDWDRITEL